MIDTEGEGQDAGPDSSTLVPWTRVMGARFSLLDEQSIVHAIVTLGVSGRGCWVITANLDHLRQFHHDPGARALIESADIVAADGAPIVWASRIANDPVPERVAGSDMIWSLCELATARGASIFLLGGEPGVAEESKAVLQQRFPDLRIAGFMCPDFGFEHSRAKLAAIDEVVLNSHPDIVLVALGFPKQDRLIARLSKLHPSAAYVGVGIGLSFVAGRVGRAPQWMRRCGLEWVHRLYQEPARLGRRYLVHGLPFAVRLLISAFAARIGLVGRESWGRGFARDPGHAMRGRR